MHWQDFEPKEHIQDSKQHQNHRNDQKPECKWQFPHTSSLSAYQMAQILQTYTIRPCAIRISSGSGIFPDNYEA
jgi:hypothetical protein